MNHKSANGCFMHISRSLTVTLYSRASSQSSLVNYSCFQTTMSTPSDIRAAALLAHVVSQLQSNIDFLVSQNYISSSDASVIMSKLPALSGETQIVSQAQAMSINHPVAPARRGIPSPPPPSRRFQARALWSYNENGQVWRTVSFFTT